MQGSGTIDSPYLVSSIEDMIAMNDIKGELGDYVYITQVNDIVTSGVEIEGINDYVIYEGNNHILSNVRMKRLGYTSVIKNLDINNILYTDIIYNIFYNESGHLNKYTDTGYGFILLQEGFAENINLVIETHITGIVINNEADIELKNTENIVYNFSSFYSDSAASEFVGTGTIIKDDSTRIINCTINSTVIAAVNSEYDLEINVYGACKNSVLYAETPREIYGKVINTLIKLDVTGNVYSIRSIGRVRAEEVGVHLNCNINYSSENRKPTIYCGTGPEPIGSDITIKNDYCIADIKSLSDYDLYCSPDSDFHYSKSYTVINNIGSVGQMTIAKGSASISINSRHDDIVKAKVNPFNVYLYVNDNIKDISEFSRTNNLWPDEQLGVTGDICLSNVTTAPGEIIKFVKLANKWHMILLNTPKFYVNTEDNVLLFVKSYGFDGGYYKVTYKEKAIVSKGGETSIPFNSYYSDVDGARENVSGYGLYTDVENAKQYIKIEGTDWIELDKLITVDNYIYYYFYTEEIHFNDPRQESNFKIGGTDWTVGKLVYNLNYIDSTYVYYTVGPNNTQNPKSGLGVIRGLDSSVWCNKYSKFNEIRVVKEVPPGGYAGDAEIVKINGHIEEYYANKGFPTLRNLRYNKIFTMNSNNNKIKLCNNKVILGLNYIKASGGTGLLAGINLTEEIFANSNILRIAVNNEPNILI